MKIEFKDCNIPLTRDNLIKISEEIGERFYAKTIESITYKNPWDKKHDSVTNRVEPIYVLKNSYNSYIVVRNNDMDYTYKETFDNGMCIKKTVIVGLCPIEFDVNEEEWKVSF